MMRESRLSWYGHMRTRQGDGVLGEVMEMEVPGTKPRGRPKETWMNNIEEDMCDWNPLDDVYDCVTWRAFIKSQINFPWRKKNSKRRR